MNPPPNAAQGGELKRASRAKPCSINYALWWCSAHHSGLNDEGKCLHAQRRLTRPPSPQGDSRWAEKAAREIDQRFCNEPGYTEEILAIILKHAPAVVGEGEERRRLDWLESQYVEVRTPLRHGSRENFVAQAINEDDEPHKTNLRQAIDSALAAHRPAPKN